MRRREALALLASVPANGAVDGLWGAQRGVAVVLDAAGRAVWVHRPEAASQLVAPPGSLLKPIVLNALLAGGRLKPAETHACSGKLFVAGRNFACVHPRTHTPLDTASAIAYSCNDFVAWAAQRLSPNELAGVFSQSGIGSAIGLGGGNEVSGKAVEVRPAQLALQALGEYGVSATVFGIARAYRRLAARAAEPVMLGLEGAVKYGTAQNAAVPGDLVAGKTGSASGAWAWFAGFAPSRSAKFTVAVLVQGYSGGADAAPIGGRLLRAALEGRL